MATRLDEFASLLRELKERSGRSYGALGARLHISTSTLHRYCNGTSVPQDYAPIERFARVCGATAEELLELHRRWILADAERSNTKDTAAGAGAAPPADTQEPPTTAAPSDPPPALPLPGRDDDVPETTAEGPVDPQTRLSLPRSAGRPRRRRATAVSAVLLAVVGVGAAAALPAALSPGHPAGYAADASPSRSGTRPSGPQASPSGSQSPSASASRSASPDSSPQTTAASSGRTQTGSEGTPFGVNVLDDNWNNPCGWLYMGKQPHTTMPVPALNEAPQTWAGAVGAVHAGHLRFELTIQGTTSQAVVLHSLTVHIVTSVPAPTSWTAYTLADGCGGGLQPAYYAINLDSSAPQATPEAGTQADGTRIPASSFPYQVSSADPQVIDLDAAVSSADVTWYLDLVWSSGTQQGTYRIDDNGHPFHTIGTSGAPHYTWHTGSTTWSVATTNG